jgi:hypothetical protein
MSQSEGISTCSGSGRSSVSLKGISSVNARHLRQRSTTSEPCMYVLPQAPGCHAVSRARLGTSVSPAWPHGHYALVLLAYGVGRDAEIRLARLIDAVAPAILQGGNIESEDKHVATCDIAEPPERCKDTGRRIVSEGS